MSSTGMVRARKLSLAKAAEIALRNIRIRWSRSILVTSGIVLAIAFLLYILISESFLGAVQERGSRELLEALRKSGFLTPVEEQEQSLVETYWLVGIALIISFVGILNAMVISVTERTREIGTMKCLGALDSFIVRMYLLESMFQGVIGTLIGIVVGLVVAYGEALSVYGSEVFGLLTVPTLLGMLAGTFAVGVVLTVLGAIYPAVHAARMQPIDAMRTEV